MQGECVFWPETEFIDFETLKANFGNHDELLLKMMQLLLHQSPIWVTELKAAYLSRNIADLRGLCHKIRGGATTAQAIAICQDLNLFCEFVRNGDLELDVAQKAFDQLMETIQKTCQYVNLLDVSLEKD